MEKQIIIDGKKIKLETNGLVPFIYKKHLERDFFDDVYTLSTGAADIEILYYLTWVFAKTADSELPDLETWFSSFTAFPVRKYINELVSLSVASLSTGEKKEKKHKATEEND
ncbi:MAG: hypothetical protein E7397_04580 [Ruminococcaceae bacterium]|nr:hypothetical protein [Oscillospiraceae bacterium]